MTFLSACARQTKWQLDKVACFRVLTFHDVDPALLVIWTAHNQRRATMEVLIARLLKDFELGKMSRRQLVQSLALVAVAAAPGAATATAASEGAGTAAPWKTVWLDHISYAVADYKKSTAFYRELMGWEVQNDNGTSQATLKIGNIGGIIIRNARQPAVNPQPTQPGRPPLTGVINHVSWGIEPWDTDGVETELKRRGLNPRPDMVGDNFKSFHVTDPDGWDLQISNKTSNAR
jgi:catechol 2,3-dioxygenase-like lactoylglutathione lyase family enzyme